VLGLTLQLNALTAQRAETRTSLARITERPAGSELRTFECSKRGYILSVMVEAE
jgi:hypothetical protein